MLSDFTFVIPFDKLRHIRGYFVPTAFFADLFVIPNVNGGFVGHAALSELVTIVVAATVLRKKDEVLRAALIIVFFKKRCPKFSVRYSRCDNFLCRHKTPSAVAVDLAKQFPQFFGERMADNFLGFFYLVFGARRL